MRPIVLDTNVIVAGLRSRRGAAHAILRQLPRSAFQPVISVPVLLEYEEVLKRPGLLSHLTAEDIDAFLDYYCQLAVEQRIFFDWRPCLTDPDDDMLVELAVASRAEFLVTGDVRHLTPARRFGVQVVTPADFMAYLLPR